MNAKKKKKTLVLKNIIFIKSYVRVIGGCIAIVLIFLILIQIIKN